MFAAASAHPMPDVPVHSAFQPTGEATITIELDPRCFEEDPETAPYLLARDFASGVTAEERDALIRTAQAYIPTVVEFEFKPGGKITPEFTCEFITNQGEDLGTTDEVIYLSAQATIRVPHGAESYRLHAIDHGYLTVLFYNELAGKAVERFQALFPGESSYWLDLQGGTLLAETPPPANPSPPARSNLAVFIIGSILVLGTVGWMTWRASART